MSSFTMKSLILNFLFTLTICGVKSATYPPPTGSDQNSSSNLLLTQKCVKTFHGTWLDANKVKQTGYACSTTGNVQPHDVYLCKTIVTEAEAKGCANPKVSKCHGGYTSPTMDNKHDDQKTKDENKSKNSKAKDEKNKDEKAHNGATSVFCRDAPGGPTMQCETLTRPAIFGDCVQAGPNTYDEHKNDWLIHAA
ncbi:hypothetical protein DFH28DRAFT_1190710 [Melampsora americana]|nr:hypothetical protein DFH28DRAFT_1190710 [Melampsora americana]